MKMYFPYWFPVFIGYTNIRDVKVFLTIRNIFIFLVIVVAYITLIVHFIRLLFTTIYFLLQADLTKKKTHFLTV